MVYTLIAKLEKFTSEDDDVQVWLNNMEKAIVANGWNDTKAMQAIPYFLQDTTNSWYQSLVNKPQNFAAFKLVFLQYFSNNNSINQLANTFITIKQRENEAADYFTVPQILNQFIRGLHSSILQCICPIHPADLQAAVTNARDFELAELELPIQPSIISTDLPINDTTANISTICILTSSLLTAATDNISTTAATNNLSDTHRTGYTQNLSSQNYLSLLVTTEDTSLNTQEPKQKQSLTNILPATVMEDESLAAIFPFKIKELTETSLFSGAAFEKKSIMVIYTDAKINGQSIKLILDTASAKIITADGITKTLIGEINNLPIEINNITVSIKVLVIEATQYQTLLSQNGQHTCVPAMCGHFKSIIMPSTPLIEFEKEKEKPTWENTDQNWKTDNDQDKPANWEKGKKKEEETILTNSTYSLNTYILLPPSNYYQPKLEYIDCGKKLSSMSTCYSDNKEYSMTTRFYYRPCIIKCFGRPKQQEKWDNQSCLTCKTILPNERMWNDIPGHGETCNETCQMAYVKAEGATTSKLLEIKNNLLSLPEPKYVQTFDVFGNIEDNPEEFHEHYQHLASIREEQKQRLEQLNT
ncbi:hypothetical protein G9A89_017136 [Geosiphon pyriformis]|nr:hypothetical protein G9A89_017136 [Geosiphon pyriformis]